jgi:hypothetical protein
MRHSGRGAIEMLNRIAVGYPAGEFSAKGIHADQERNG